MEIKITTLAAKNLVGMHLKMTFANNRTGELWRNFMPRKNEIQHKTGTELISLQQYKTGFFDNFNPNESFEKWACAEVSEFGKIPDQMNVFALEGGLYAVFFYVGNAAKEAPELFRYIFSEWLPNSEYVLDNRPHFEVLGEKYKNNDDSSEEEIWIPIKLK